MLRAGASSNPNLGLFLLPGFLSMPSTSDSICFDSQLLRRLNVSRAEKHFGFRAKTEFEDGLRHKIEWCQQLL